MGPLSGVDPVGANPLLQVSPGLMIWTIVVFLLTLLIMKKFVFGPVGQAIEKRRASIAASIEEAESSRDEAVRLLDEYKAEWEKINPSPPTFMGEPIPAERMERFRKMRAERDAADRREG